jgi:hypothetical protein
MRSQLTEVPDQVAPAEPPPPPPPAGTVVNLSDYENGGPAAAEAEPDEPEVELADQTATVVEEAHEEPEAEPATPGETESSVEAAEPDDAAPVDGAVEPDVAAAEEPPDERAEEPAEADDATEQVAVGAVSGLAALGNVAVIEGAGGVTVTASTRLGKTKSRTAPPSPGGVDRAIVSAVSRLLVPEQDPPLLVEIIDADRDGELILTVVLELEAGHHAVGSAIQAANRSWALARATRAALNVPE